MLFSMVMLVSKYNDFFTDEKMNQATPPAYTLNICKLPSHSPKNLYF